MSEIDIIIILMNELRIPVWIPILAAGVLRFLELKFNIFRSKKIQK